MEIPSADIDRLSTESPVVNGMAIPNPTADTTAGIVLNNQVKAAELNAQLQNAAIEIEAPKPEAPDTEAETPDTELSEGNKPETGKDDAAIEGNGDGNESYTYTYDKRGNRTAEIGKKASRSYVYDETNRMVEGTNWKGDKSAYTYNGLGIRINNTHTTHAGKVYARDYVIDYTSFENDDLMVFAEGNGQLEYEQKHVYAGSERIEQFTDKGNWERTLYVHEDVMGNTRYYTKANGQSFAELTYDAWGMPVSPNKLLNNDHGNYVFATFTGHIYDTTLDIYFAEARFYDASNRTWLAMDPIKDGLNWYQYCYSNPTTYWDPLGLAPISKFTPLAGSEMDAALFWHQSGYFTENWWRDENKLNEAFYYLQKEAKSRGGMSLSYLSDLYNNYERYGMTNERMRTLQRVLGVTPSGVYDPSVTTVLRAALGYEGKKFDLDNPNLTFENLNAIVKYAEYMDTIGTTIAIGGSLGASAGIRGAASFAFVGDNKENVALQGSFSAGGGGLQAPGGSLSIAVTNAPNIDALEGWGSQVGGSLTICFITVGADYLIIPNSKGDDYHGVSINLGLSSVPFWIDYGGQESYTKTIIRN